MSSRCLITGAHGFVGTHLVRHLVATGSASAILALDRGDTPRPSVSPTACPITFGTFDLMNRTELQRAIEAFCPDWVFHLASHSSVSQSWNDPIGSFVNNTNILLNLLEAVRTGCPRARFLSVGSSEEYGRIDERHLPLTEDAPLRPTSPYAVARVAQEQLSSIYREAYGLHIVMTRSFNHIGPGQSTRFAVPSFLAQLVQLRDLPLEQRILETGDTSVIRDFTDVRDVVRAYELLLEKGNAGDVYNVCSGRPTSLVDVIEEACNLLQLRVHITKDPARVRPLENRCIVGSSEKLCRAVGWRPQFSLNDSLRDILAELGVAERHPA